MRKGEDDFGYKQVKLALPGEHLEWTCLLIVGNTDVKLTKDLNLMFGDVMLRIISIM